MTRRLHNVALWVCTAGVAWLVTLPCALAKKMSTKLGFSVPELGVDKLIKTILTPAGDTDGAIGGDLTATANAFWAGVLVLLLMFVVIGCVRLASGSRGAGEKLALVFGGTILMIAAVGVFQ